MKTKGICISLVKYTLTLFIGCLCIARTTAQTVEVRDKSSLQPLEGVSITGQSGNKVTTDARGQAVLDGSFTGNVTLTSPYYNTLIVSLDNLTPENGMYTVYLRERNIAIDELVVSASRFEEKKTDVPQQVQVVNSTNLRFMNQQTSADVLTQTGNVMVQKSQQGGGSPVIRGFEANKVLIVVDGVRMNNAIYRGGHLQNVLRIDNNMLDKVEVVFGPGSVVYGSDALGGVMHFYSRRPSLAKGTAANAYYRFGSVNNEHTGHFDVNVSDGRLASLTSFTFTDFGDLRQGKNRADKWDSLGYRNFYQGRINGRDTMFPNSDPAKQIVSGYRQTDILQKFLYQQDENTSHILNFQYSNSSDVPRYDRLTDLSASGLFRSAEWYYGPEKRLLTSYTYEKRNQGSFFDNLRIIGAYQFVEESRNNRGFQKNILTSQVEKVNIGSFNVDMDKRIGQFELRYGAEVAYNEVTSTATTTNIVTKAKGIASTRYPDGGSNYYQAAAYITSAWEISKKLIASAGVRYSLVGLNATFDDTTFFPFPYHTASQRNSAVNGNLGMVWLPGAGFRISVVGSTGFRAPNVDDLAKVFESTPGSVVVPNPNLKPEYTYNAEVGISKQFGKWVRVDVNGFYTWIHDLISMQPSQFNGQDSIMYDGVMSRVLSSQNSDRAFIYGFSAGITGDLTSNIALTSTLNYTYGRINTAGQPETPLDHIAPMFGRTGVQVKYNRFKGEFYALYSAKKDVKDYSNSGEDNIQYALPTGMPGWYTLNLRVNYAWTTNVQFQVAVENILDSYYRVFASGISAPGRNISLTVRGSF